MTQFNRDGPGESGGGLGVPPLSTLLREIAGAVLVVALPFALWFVAALVR